MLAELFGLDGMVIVVVVAVVLFGSTQIPKLARSLGSAHKEFKSGLHEGDGVAAGTAVVAGTPVVVAPVAPIVIAPVVAAPAATRVTAPR